MGHPSLKDFVQILDAGLIPGCPLNWYDAQVAEDIFGLDEGILKGKTARRAPHRVVNPITAVPVEVYEWYREVTLTVDVMFVNQLPMFITVSHHIQGWYGGADQQPLAIDIH